MAPTTTNYSEIQHDEIEALRSIYMDDFAEEEAKTGPWKKAADRAFHIHLRTQTGDEREIALTLAVSLPPTYPKSLPRLSLRFGNVMRDQEQKQARDIINSKPKSLLGSEMIFEIATSLQDILDDISISREIVPTLDEERIAREVAARLKAQQNEEENRQKVVKAEEEVRIFRSESLSFGSKFGSHTTILRTVLPGGKGVSSCSVPKLGPRPSFCSRLWGVFPLFCTTLGLHTTFSYVRFGVKLSYLVGKLGHIPILHAYFGGFSPCSVPNLGP